MLVHGGEPLVDIIYTMMNRSMQTMPKQESPDSYRPIALNTVCYKIFTRWPTILRNSTQSPWDSKRLLPSSSWDRNGHMYATKTCILPLLMFLTSHEMGIWLSGAVLGRRDCIQPGVQKLRTCCILLSLWESHLKEVGCYSNFGVYAILYDESFDVAIQTRTAQY